MTPDPYLEIWYDGARTYTTLKDLSYEGVGRILKHHAENLEADTQRTRDWYAENPEEAAEE
jgi:hypothetical protein